MRLICQLESLLLCRTSFCLEKKIENRSAQAEHFYQTIVPPSILRSAGPAPDKLRAEISEASLPAVGQEPEKPLAGLAGGWGEHTGRGPGSNPADPVSSAGFPGKARHSPSAGRVEKVTRGRSPVTRRVLIAGPGARGGSATPAGDSATPAGGSAQLRLPPAAGRGCREQPGRGSCAGACHRRWAFKSVSLGHRCLCRIWPRTVGLVADNTRRAERRMSPSEEFLTLPCMVKLFI